MKKRTCLIKLEQHFHKQNGYKFGIKIPKTIEETLNLDKENSNHLWEDLIVKEMNGVKVAFGIK